MSEAPSPAPDKSLGPPARAEKVRPKEIPAWYPDWARKLAELYFSGTTCVFILHGNVHDLIHCRGENGQDRFISLSEFLATQIFGSWDVVLSYDLGGGLQPEPGAKQERLMEMMKYLSTKLGPRTNWPNGPDQVLSVVQQLAERNLLESLPANRKQIAFLFPYSQYLIPAGDLTMLAGGKASRLVQLLSWAQNPYFKRVNMAFCLIADKLSEVNERLVTSPHVATIELPLPDEKTRRAFAEQIFAKSEARKPDASLGTEGLTQLSSGLNLVSLNVVLTGGGPERTLDVSQFSTLKKAMIERQCQGLVSFVQPSVKLDLVVGHEAAKKRLEQDAKWIGQGRLDASPMGYLFCGPVGTGKTFLAECYAGSIGIPCITLQNFRSKYVGETEGNLEHLLNVLRSLGPVIVIVDEADAALGDRRDSGDSGTSGRVFSMISSQMGNTKYRGRIIWMLLTCRPDLLPIDLKRQGRAEVHIPLFYPTTAAEISQMLRVMAKKNKTQIADDAVPEVSPDRQLSGSDLESILLSARRAAMAADRDVVTRADLQTALDDFIPSAQGMEKEMQELAAVLECTDRSFLTESWRQKLAEPDGRTRLQERFQGLRRIVEQM